MLEAVAARRDDGIATGRGGRRVIIENAGHGAHFAEPEKFNRAVLEFFEGVGIR